jgi:hypothetical protein
MPGTAEMRIVSINEHIPELLAKAPHRFYVLEIDLKDLWTFERDPWGVLARFPGLEDVTEDTNLHVIGLNGDKGNLPTDYVKKTHAFILDFRPLGIEVVYWKCRSPGEEPARQRQLRDAHDAGPR